MTDHDRIETDLHEAVQSYGTSVSPTDRLGEIRRATRGRRRVAWQRPWVLVAGAAFVTATIVVGAMALLAPGSTSSSSRPHPPAGTDARRPVTVYEVREVDGHPWLYPEQVVTVDTGDVAYDAVLALIGAGGDSQGGRRWEGCPMGSLESVDVSREVVTVSLTGPVTQCDQEPTYRQAQLQQLAWTVHDAVVPGAQVVLESGGQQLTPQPFTADANALSPVLIDLPADGAPVFSPVTVQGRGNTFEGNVEWQVWDAGGAVVRHGHETAGSYGEFRPFWFTVDLPPGDYTARAFEMSAESGSLYAEDTSTFTVE